MIKVFLNAPYKDTVISQLQEQYHITPALAETYYVEIKTLLESVNTVPNDSIEITAIPPLPQPEHVCHYSFGNTNITVNYGSKNIQNLIHPQRAHAQVSRNETSETIFDIFESDNMIFLFKNNNYIGHYQPLEQHFLQGQFSLQLINSIYDKTEADWVATFHASTVCNDKEAIMIIGDSGNGKSTLSAVLMAHGFDLLADDFTPLAAANSNLYRVPSAISIKAGAFDMLQSLFQDLEILPIYQSTSKSVNIKYIPPAIDFGTASSHFPCKKVVYVKYDLNATTILKEVPTEKILETLIPESWLSPLAANSKLFLEWAQKLQCYELIYSDNTMAVSEFSKLFES